MMMIGLTKALFQVKNGRKSIASKCSSLAVRLPVAAGSEVT